MKRTVLRFEVELEGPTVDGGRFRDWLLDVQPDEEWREDMFRVVQVQLLREDGRAR